MSAEHDNPSRPTRTTPRDAVVVCPTEYGGQLEHAADLALALLEDPQADRVWLVSRPGAREYLGWGSDHPIQVVETVPPRRPQSPESKLGKLVKPVLQVADLLREHAAVRSVAKQADGRAVLALDSTKYPLPRVLCASRNQAVSVFVHNAQPHFDLTNPSVRELVLLWLERSCARRSDQVITHGQDQGEIVRGYTAKPVTAVDLPVSSRLELADAPASSAIPSMPYALCIGELRANKGIELAMDAAVRADIPLLVRGAAESPELSYSLARRAAAGRCVDFADEFLSREDFNAFILNAAVIVLPYTHFDAHSGVLAKAVGAEVSVVSSDLASLRAQAGDYPHFTAADVHDTDAFGAALRTAFDAAVSGSRDSSRQPVGEGSGHGTHAAAASASKHQDWAPSVAAVTSAERA